MSYWIRCRKDKIINSYILDRHTDPNNPVMKVTQDDKIPIYDSKADAEADIANIEEGAIVATKDTGATEKVVDVVQDGNMNPVTSNAVAKKYHRYATYLTHTSSSGSWVEKTVTFDEPFKDKPLVSVWSNSDMFDPAAPEYWMYFIRPILTYVTTTGCKVWLYSRDNITNDVQVQAIGEVE